jgi:hypothetical protein
MTGRWVRDIERPKNGGTEVRWKREALVEKIVVKGIELVLNRLCVQLGHYA